MLIVTGVDLPAKKACRCGSTKADARFTGVHFKGACTACGVDLPDWLSREIVLGERGRRKRVFDVDVSIRMRTFARDQYTCVHCNRHAPRELDGLLFIEEVLDAEIGAHWREHSLDAEHQAACYACGQLLPGIFRTLPAQVFMQLPLERRERIFARLDEGRLTIDHILPVAILEKIELHREELQILNETLLVTACLECNLGRGKLLEPLERIEVFFKQYVSRDLKIDQKQVWGWITGIHLRARVYLRDSQSKGQEKTG